MTQYELIIKYIRDFGSISPYEAFKDLGVTKLATRISEMRQMGYKFDDEWFNTVNRYGAEVRYKRYRLIYVGTEKLLKKEKPKKKSFWQRLWGL